MPGRGLSLSWEKLDSMECRMSARVPFTLPERDIFPSTGRFSKGRISLHSPMSLTLDFHSPSILGESFSPKMSRPSPRKKSPQRSPPKASALSLSSRDPDMAPALNLLNEKFLDLAWTSSHSVFSPIPYIPSASKPPFIAELPVRKFRMSAVSFKG